MNNLWSGNWEELLRAKLKEKHFSNVTEYLRSRENVPFKVIAEELLGDQLAPVQIQKVLRKEVQNEVDKRYFVLTSLARNLHQHTPSGLKEHKDWDLTLALSSWVGGMDQDIQSACVRLGKKLKKIEGIEPDWLPESSEDPVLLELYEKVICRVRS